MIVIRQVLFILVISQIFLFEVYSHILSPKIIRGGLVNIGFFLINENNQRDSVDYEDDFDKNTFSLKVLTTGIFHDEEVWVGADKEKWYGLFKNKEGFYFKETEIKIRRVHDDIVDSKETEKTGWEVSTTNRDDCILLVEQKPYFSNHVVQNLSLGRVEIMPGDTLSFNYLGIDYKLFATGIKKKAKHQSDAFDIFNYKLFLSANKNGKLITELLMSHSSFTDQMTGVIFVGDIDNDGFLDLIIDGSDHYNVTFPVLYLSKPAESENLLKIVGGHQSVGC